MVRMAMGAMRALPSGCLSFRDSVGQITRRPVSGRIRRRDLAGGWVGCCYLIIIQEHGHTCWISPSHDVGGQGRRAGEAGVEAGVVMHRRRRDGEREDVSRERETGRRGGEKRRSGNTTVRSMRSAETSTEYAKCRCTGYAHGGYNEPCSAFPRESIVDIESIHTSTIDMN